MLDLEEHVRELFSPDHWWQWHKHVPAGTHAPNGRRLVTREDLYFRRLAVRQMDRRLREARAPAKCAVCFGPAAARVLANAFDRPGEEVDVCERHRVLPASAVSERTAASMRGLRERDGSWTRKANGSRGT